MDEDTEMAAWHQLELEQQEAQEILRADPAFLEWLEAIESLNNQELNAYEIRSESHS